MTFNPNIPQATDRFPISQGQLLTNFTALNTIFGINHVALNAAADAGKHNFCQFPEQGAAPGTAANEGAIYTKNAATGTTEAFFQRESSGTELQLTGINGTNVAAAGGTLLPSGLIIKWGTATVSNGNTVTFAVAPAFTTVYGIYPGILNAGGAGVVNEAIYIRSFTANNFVVTCTRRTSLSAIPGTMNIMYYALGV
jgi:hypothetical protein